MTQHVTSADGTRIAYDTYGDGPPVILVSGMFCDRQVTRELAERLAGLLTGTFSVVNYDRRGRGDSGDTAPYAVEREVEDLAALAAASGGVAAVYGHSSGAGLALTAAGTGLAVTHLVLHEPPYGPDDEESRRSSRELAEGVREAVQEDRRADAIALFLQSSGVPEDAVAAMTRDPRMLAIAPTMPYDFAVMGDAERGGTIPEDLVRGIDVPTLVIAGGASPAFFQETAARLVPLLPRGSHRLLPDQDHGAPAEVVAPVVADFVTDRARA